MCAYFAIIFFGKRKVKPEKSIQRKTDGFLSYYIYNILQRSITWTVVNCPLLTCITTLLLSLISCFSDILIRMLESYYKTVRNPWQFWIFVYSQLCQLAGLPQNKWGWPSTLETALCLGGVQFVVLNFTYKDSNKVSEISSSNPSFNRR